MTTVGTCLCEAIEVTCDENLRKSLPVIVKVARKPLAGSAPTMW